MKNIIKLAFCILFIAIANSAYADNSTQQINTNTSNKVITHDAILPAKLQQGDTVALVASGFRVPDEETIQFAAERIEALGLKVKYGNSLHQKNTYYSGTDSQRAQDLNQMFADKTVKAIFEIRGGWGSNRVLPYLDFNLIKKNPKIILGFSDITSLLLAINAKTNLVTFHGTMGVESWPAFTVDYLKRVLMQGEAVTFANPISIDQDKDIIQTDNRITTITGGTAEGKLLGGNLSTLNSMLGSSYLPNWRGNILFIEDVDENYYQIDRMLEQLKLAGVLNKISGFIFGQCVGCSAGNNSSTSTVIGSANLEQILNHYIKPLGIPAWSGAMIGHMPKMFTLPEGLPVKIDADKGTIQMLEPAVS